MIVIDAEFSGLNPHKHSILSLGAVEYERPENRFYEECRIWDGAHVMREALLMNDFDEENIRDEKKQTEGQLLEKFFNWARDVSDHTLAGHSPHFDLNFIQEATSRWKLNFPLAQRTIDLHTICWMHMKQKGVEVPLSSGRSALNSDFVFTYTGLPEEPKPHNALNGALFNTEALSRLLEKRNLITDFTRYQIPWEK